MRKSTKISEIIIERAISFKLKDNYNGYYSWKQLLGLLNENNLDIEVSKMNPQWARKVLAVMQSRNLKNSTIKTYFGRLNSIFNFAVYKKVCKPENAFIQRNPYEYDRIKLNKPYFDVSEKSLTKEQMGEVYRYFKNLPATTNKERNHKTRIGLFLLSYLQNGMNLNDIIRLRKNNKAYDDGFLVFARNKVKNTTAMKIKIPLIETLLDIYTELGVSLEKTPNNSLIFGFMSNNDNEFNITKITQHLTVKIGRSLVKMSKALGFGKPITFGFARKSYSTVLNNAGVNSNYIELNLGHTIGMAGHYLTSFDKEFYFKANSLLLDIKTDENQMQKTC